MQSPVTIKVFATERPKPYTARDFHFVINVTFRKMVNGRAKSANKNERGTHILYMDSDGVGNGGICPLSSPGKCSLAPKEL